MAKKEVKKTKEVRKDEEDFLDEKKDKKSLFQRIMNVILWIVLFVWMGICLFDFYNVHQTKDPVFCLKRETITYKDGSVKSCLGLGYKIYQYNRKCFKAIEYGPFWTKDRSLEAETCEGVNPKTTDN